MPTVRKTTPNYLEHKQSGRTRVAWYDGTGKRQQKLLPGPFNSPESQTTYANFHELVTI